MEKSEIARLLKEAIAKELRLTLVEKEVASADRLKLLSDSEVIDTFNEWCVDREPTQSPLVNKARKNKKIRKPKKH